MSGNVQGSISPRRGEALTSPFHPLPLHLGSHLSIFSVSPQSRKSGAPPPSPGAGDRPAGPGERVRRPRGADEDARSVSPEPAARLPESASSGGGWGA